MEKQDNQQRLQKLIAEAGIASRRAAEQLISEGRVTVNHRVVTSLGSKADKAKDLIAVDGKILRFTANKRYIMLHKPVGYITSVHDERGRRTVMDLLKNVDERVYPVGRLDYDSSGLLLMTNDGELTNQLLHPSQEVGKTYLAEVEGIITREKLNMLKRGIRLEDGMTAPAEVRPLRSDKENSRIEITIHEGRNRQVRRMFDALGHPVIRLKRIKLGPLSIGDLQAGSWRELTVEEINSLLSLSKVHGGDSDGSKR